MKPVVIIAIAVVCSVVAVLVVLVGLEQIVTMQAQQAYDEYEQELKIQEKIEQDYLDFLDSKNRDICVGLFGNQMGDIYSGEIHIYQYCLQSGFELAVERETNRCYDSQFPSSSMICSLSLEIKLIEVLKSIEGFSELQLQIMDNKQTQLIKELTIVESSYKDTRLLVDIDWDDPATYEAIQKVAIDEYCREQKVLRPNNEPIGSCVSWQLEQDELEEINAQNIQKERERILSLDSELLDVGDTISLYRIQSLDKYLNSDTSEWSEIYSNCLSTPVKYFEGDHVRETFCTQILENVWYQTCDFKPATCQLLLSDIMNDDPLWSNVGNVHNETWNSYSKSCKANGGTDYKKCMCDTELISQNWVKLCVDDVE
jgi:hypothetical protein